MEYLYPYLKASPLSTQNPPQKSREDSATSTLVQDSASTLVQDSARSSRLSTKLHSYSPISILSQTEYTLASRYGSTKLINSSSLCRPRRELDQYAIKKTLGAGSFAKVKLCQHIKTGDRLAVKVIEKVNVKSAKLRTSVKREIRLNKLIFHPHIARVHEMLETESTIFIMMEYVEGGELFDYIIGKRHLQEKESRHFFRQIISAIDYLHKSSIVHRDLKPENLLLDKTKRIIKLVDFGLGNTWQKEVKLETYCGSPFYAAPEMIAATPYTGPEVDVWSMGVILFALVAGRLPFDSTCMRTLYSTIMNGDYEIPQFFSQDLSRLITKMLRVNPDSRYTIDEIAKDKWTNIGYTETPDSFIPFRPDVIGTPHKKSVSELSSFGIKESDIIAVIRNPELRHHPLTSLYHLCNEMRIRLESEQKHTLSTASPLDFKLETGLLGSLHIGDSTDYSTQQTGKKAALKAASSKVALAFKKFFQNGLKPLPHRKYKSKYNAAVQSAQVLPTSEYRVRTELARKPVPTILDSDRGSYIQSQTHQQSGGVRQGDFQTFTLNATSFSSTSPPPSVPTSGGYVYQTLERKPVPIGANQFNQTLSPPPTPGQSPNVPLQQQSSRPSFPLRHKKQSRSDGYEFIKKQMMNQALVL